MSNDLLQNIEEKMFSFSKGQKRIANFIINHYDKAAYMTAIKLGQEVGVSESTVVRFAEEIGLDGYPELRRAIQSTVKTRLTSVQRMEVSNTRLANKGILDSVLNEDAEKIRYTSEHIDHTSFDRAIDSIVNAHRIYIIGMRSCSGIAEFMNFYFGLMFKDVVCIRSTSGSDIFEQLMHMQADDVMIAISFPRYSNRVINASDYATSLGAKLIAITDSESSPIAQKAYASLTASSDMASFADSLVAPLSIINAMIAAIAQKKDVEVSENLSKLEKIWDAYDVYQKADKKKEK